ncbi:Bullous pemphigoid antigen 1 [Temnothorax longispinosus]|uniref:Bullous pemphigoid antigen 1 n=1 Tax=Temnothorax longispinosus TaxID=300112 RepID=A0A4S2JBD3_9HYME|nr:Bullous pemphigoid antigen 1 [Temnothorax longispinosus]
MPKRHVRNYRVASRDRTRRTGSNVLSPCPLPHIRPFTRVTSEMRGISTVLPHEKGTGVSQCVVKWNASKSSFKTRRRDLLQLVTVTKGGWEADHKLFCQSLDIYSPDGCAGHATHARVHACVLRCEKRQLTCPFWNLLQASRHVGDLFEDLRDGHNLISLLEVLSGEGLPREKGRMRFHMLQNVQMALDFLRYKKIKLVNIRAEDIVSGAAILRDVMISAILPSYNDRNNDEP